MADRFGIVCRELCGLFQNGIVVSYARPVNGGDPLPLDRTLWFTEGFWKRFFTCRIDLADPFQTRSSQASTHYIYVDKAAFMALVEATDPIPPQSADNEKTTSNAIETIKRGRPPAYDWDSFNQEVIRRVVADGKPDNIRAFSASMLLWCSDVWGAEPSESRVRSRISKLLAINLDQS